MNRRHVVVNDVELVGALRDMLDHQHVSRQWIRTADQALRSIARRDERRCRLRITTREQRDGMALPDELIGQHRNDSLGPSVELWWNTFTQRCNLRNSQVPRRPYTHSSLLPY